MSIGLSVMVYTAIGAAMVAVVIALLRTGKPLRIATASLIEGVCAMAAVDVVGIFSGVSLGFGWFSMACCAAFGIPGVISMLVMRMITLL